MSVFRWSHFHVEHFTVFSNRVLCVFIHWDFDEAIKLYFFGWVVEILQIRMIESFINAVSVLRIECEQFSKQIEAIFVHGAEA